MVREQQSQRHRGMPAASASCWLTPYSYYHHFFFPSLTAKGVSCFPRFHESSAAIGILLLPLLNDEDQLFCRSRAARLPWHPQHYTTALAEDPSPRKPAFFQKSCYSRHFTFIPTRRSAHVPWVWTYSYCNGSLHPETGHLEMGRERFGSRKAPS